MDERTTLTDDEIRTDPRAEVMDDDDDADGTDSTDSTDADSDDTDADSDGTDS
jgi:hypothetical protein